jgi:hypothetical protein
MDMSSTASLLNQALIAERDAHRRQVALVRASLQLRPELARDATTLPGGRRA